MTSLLIVIVLVSLFCAAFIVYTVLFESQSHPENQILKVSSKSLVILPLIFVVTSPILYFSLDSFAKQSDWKAVVNKTKILTDGGEIQSMDISMQDLILGLRTAAHQNPENGALWYELGETYFKLQMRDAALASWQRAIRIESNPDWLVATAQLLASGSDSDENRQALDLLNQALTLDADHQGGLLTLGFTYFKNADYQNAIDAWQKLASLESISDKSRGFIQQQILQAREMLNQSQ